MANLLMCRICLAKDVRMHLLFGTHLQEMYEELTTMPLITEDNRPILACYICHARLKNCHKLRMSCLQSEKFFTQVLSSSTLEPKHQEDICNKNSLKIAQVINLSMGDVLQKTDCAIIKTETPDTEAVAHQDHETVFLEMDNRPQQEYFVELEVVKTEPDDISSDLGNSRHDAPEEKLADSPVNLEPAQVNGKKSKWIRKKLIFIDDKKNKTIRDKKKVYKYGKNVNSGNKLYQCEVCSICYSSLGSLTRHKRQCHSVEGPYQCKICNKSYGSTSHLNRHVNTVHTGKKQYQCNLCDQSFNSEYHLNTHKHNNCTKPYQGNVCDRRYSDKSDLYKHINKPTIEKPYECDICLKSFSRNDRLQKHINLIHTRSHNSTDNKIRLFTCDVCKKDLTTRGGIISHMRTHTGEKPFQCNVCKRSFSEQSTLNNHILVHGDEKPFQCDKCDKAFKRKCHLETHVRRHTGTYYTDKPYQCNVCKKWFNNKNHLSVHFRTHTGEKPFSCSFCNLCFSHKNCFTRHMRRAHQRIEK